MNARANTTCLVIVITLLISLPGCGPSAAVDGPFSPPIDSVLLKPFAGDWTFEFDKTLELHQAGGASEEAIELLRKFYGDSSPLGKMHPDLSIDGHVAAASGGLPSEYRFFAMHQQDDQVCGKAWHHEDRFDPGDMTKCYVRLMVKDKHLYMDVRMQARLPDLNDPDLIYAPAIESGSAAEWDADSVSADDWGEWMTYVFSRQE